MCGIAGYVLRDSHASVNVVEAMCEQIRYRGPDDSGYYTDGPCAIGMRRLSIIDLGTGHQPIANEDETVWVVYNGEIYNYRELRGFLEGRGHRFRTSSDTETLVHLYEEEGYEGLHRLRGMFAFAIWDGRRRRLLLARDRFGKKPLYYAALPDGLWFGSELKCLRTAGIPLDIDPEALQLYFRFLYIPEPWSAWKAIRKLPPGGWLMYTSGGQMTAGRFWKLPFPAASPPAGTDEARAAVRLRDLFDESVRVRMIADVPLGAFLSGGIDSGSVVASMAFQSPEPVKTFSIGFEEREFNELEHAETVARAYKTDHHTMIVRPDSVALVHRLVRHFDEPFGDSSAIPTFLVSEFAVQHVKVALTGDGGDELFAGYESFFLNERLKRFDAVPLVVRAALDALGRLLPYSTYGKNYLRMISRPNALERYFESNYAPYHLLERLVEPEWMPPADAAYFQRAFADCLLPNGADVLLQALYFEATAKLTGDMLVKVDRMSMANSLEVRCPMLDHNLAEFAATLPPAWKMRGGRGKRIFLRAVGDRLPAALLSLPKKGFGIPLPLWFRGPLRELLRDTLLARHAIERGVTSPEFVRYLIAEHEAKRRDNSHWLWMLLMLELWFRASEQTSGSAPAARAVERAVQV
ncbi:MAG TPA: asparagine synthase (glutamine-hydrolyzing) [Bryobacteraceae bacterium]|nr:asparagine synthase (glutamine-hydrolyzing) [Bryobacteraceae bacterium]